MVSNKINYVVCYGEILWDIFSSGERAGGAPFNVAYNLSKMGVQTKMLSKIGNDDLGNKLLHLVTGWNLTTDYIQKDPQKDTGTVLASFDDHGDAIYDIVQDVAWDFIEYLPIHKNTIVGASAFVFGSLITRNNVSKNTLLKLIEHSKFNVFDVNFRPPYVDFDFIKILLHKADLVKMNKAELKMILGYLGIVYTNEEENIKQIQRIFDLKEVILTKGSKGAKYFVDDTVYDHPAVQIEIKDTIGSGDAFLAGFLSKRCTGASTHDIMKEATSLGAFITSKIGACPEYEYDEFLNFKINNTIQ